MRRIAVIDIGKTNVKLALVDLATSAEVAVLTRPNQVQPGPPYPHFDTEGMWAFLTGGLRHLHARHHVDGISIATHGAAGALLAQDGSLAAPVLDYEHDGPDTCRMEYEAIRPPFSETGSTRLPGGLNLGAQIFWQFRRDPDLAARVARFVTWPQYWGFRLTGEIATDFCSLGCHTDLWNPYAATFSSLPERLNISDKIAPAMAPDAVLGTITPEVAKNTKLPHDTPVLCGIHDSNASLLPHLLARTPPFAVVSTGTWVVVMAIGGEKVALNPKRDTLVNVNARGEPVPSARFMGGREYETIRAGRAGSVDKASVDAVLDRGLMLLPAVQPDSGPFQGHRMRWTEMARSDGETDAALSLYLGLMTAECLNMIGAKGPTIIEGPFAANPWYCHMIQAATGRPVRPSRSRTGTAAGAAMLFAKSSVVQVGEGAESLTPDPRLVHYAAAWLKKVRRQN